MPAPSLCARADNTIQVQEVRWNDRIMPFNTTPHTSFSQWLNVNQLYTYWPDVDELVPEQLTVIVKASVHGTTTALGGPGVGVLAALTPCPSCAWAP